MLIGPCALTTFGASTVATLATAAPPRNLRRVAEGCVFFVISIALPWIVILVTTQTRSYSQIPPFSAWLGNPWNNRKGYAPRTQYWATDGSAPIALFYAVSFAKGADFASASIILKIAPL
jgi:hypothetical protein